MAQVKIDRRVQGLLPGYLERCAGDLRTVREAADRGDFTAIRAIGHRLAGAGGLYGLDEVSAKGREINLAAHAADAQAVHRAAGALERYLGEIEPEFV